MELMAMKHAMNEKMREKVNEGKLDEATYKELVEELGRLKGEPDAPLYEVTYTENVIFAQSHTDDDSDLNTCLVHFKTDYDNPTKTKIVRGVKKNPAAYRGREILFHKYHEIDLRDDGGVEYAYKPGYTMVMSMCPDVEQCKNKCMIIYTIIKICKFNKKRKSHADPEE
jgi:hypothetical protein